MLKDTLVLLFVLHSLIDLVSRCTAPLLLDVSGKTKGLGTTARVRALVAAILEFRLLRMVSAMVKLASHELRFTHRAL